MLFRRIFDFIFASPVTMVFSVVSVACVSILVVKITSNMAPLSDVEGMTSGANTNGVSFQQNDSSSDKTSYGNQVNDAHSDDLNSGFQSRSYSPSQVGNNANKNKFNTDSEFIDVDSDDYSYSESARVDSDSSVETVNQTPSTLNFSTGNAPNSVSTTDSPTTTSGSTTSTNSNNDSTSAATTEVDEPTGTTSTEQEFPGSLEYEVKIDFEETQNISCQPVVANGPPCMCTFTRTDADGSISQLVDNCG